MAHAEKSILIRRPVASVFDFVLNGAGNKLWRSSVMDVRPLGEAPYGVGSKFEQGLKGPTGRIPGDYEITALRQNELIQFRVTAGPARPTGTYRFREREDSTEVTLALDYQPEGLSKQVNAAAAQQIFQQVRGADDEVTATAVAKLSKPEQRVLEMGSQGRTEREIAQSLFVEEGTVRNYVYSVLSKVMEPVVQRTMEQEVEMLDELKAFLEKHV